MTDWQLEWAAALSIGLELEGIEARDAFPWIGNDEHGAPDTPLGHGMPWMPLGNDDQAMQLVKRLHLHIDQRPGKQLSVQDPHFTQLVYGDLKLGDRALNRAIVQCAALMHRAK